MLFEKSLSQIDVYDWKTGFKHRDTVALTYRVGELYRQLSNAYARSPDDDDPGTPSAALA